jgi:hypothetical protein
VALIDRLDGGRQIGLAAADEATAGHGAKEGGAAKETKADAIESVIAHGRFLFVEL